MVAVGVADVVEMYAVHPLLRQLDHRFDLHLLVVWVRRAEPARLRLAAVRHLRAVGRRHLRRKHRIHAATHVPAHLPHVACHPVLAAGCKALLERIALSRHFRRCRKHLRPVERRPAPCEVRQQRVEAVLLQDPHRLVPRAAAAKPPRAMAPERAMLARLRLLRLKPRTVVRPLLRLGGLARLHLGLQRRRKVAHDRTHQRSGVAIGPA